MLLQTDNSKKALEKLNGMLWASQQHAFARALAELALLTREKPGFIKDLFSQVPPTGMPLSEILFSVNIATLKKELKLLAPSFVAAPLDYTLQLTTEVIQDVKLGKKSILDVGTGCGLTPIAAALCGASATGIDVVKSAIDTARINALLNDVDDSVVFRRADFNEFQTEKTFDLICSNPPTGITENFADTTFYDQMTKGSQDPSLSEKAISYPVDKDNAPLFQRILERAGNFLKADGYLLIVNGNVSKDNYSYFHGIAQKQGIKLPQFEVYPVRYSSFPFVNEDFIRQCILRKQEVFTDAHLEHKLLDPSQVRGIDYWFEGFFFRLKKADLKI